MREPERRDLSPLDPQREPERWERLVRRIMARSAAELQRRQAAGVFGVMDGLLAWSRPALATAAALAAVSLIALSRLGAPTQVARAAFMESAAIPAPVGAWLEQGEPPGMLDLIVLTNGGNR